MEQWIKELYNIFYREQDNWKDRLDEITYHKNIQTKLWVRRNDQPNLQKCIIKMEKDGTVD